MHPHSGWTSSTGCASTRSAIMMGAAAAAFACCVRRTRWKAHWHPLCCTPWACLPRRYGCCGTQIRWHAVCPSWRHSQMQGYVLCGSVDRLHLLLCFALLSLSLLSGCYFFVAAGPVQVCRTLGRSTTTVSLGRDIYARLCASLGDDGCTTLSTAAVSLPLPVLL